MLRRYIKLTKNIFKNLLQSFPCKYYGEIEYFFRMKIGIGIVRCTIGIRIARLSEK